MKNRSIVAALVVGFLSPVLAFAQSSRSEGSSASRSDSSRARVAAEPKNAAIRLLRKDLTDSIMWDDVSFEFVLDWLRDEGDANVVVNWNALEVVGVQLYYPGYDMLEISRLLDRFAQFGKPVHITELGVSSRNEPDENAHVKGISGAHSIPSVCSALNTL